MTRMEILEIGLALNGIATLMPSDELLATIKPQLDKIEEIVARQQIETESEGE